MTISLRDGETLQDYAVRVTAERDAIRRKLRQLQKARTRRWPIWTDHPGNDFVRLDRIYRMLNEGMVQP